MANTFTNANILMLVFFATNFAIFHLQDTATFETKLFCLASNKGWAKRLLLLYINGQYTITLQSSLAVNGDIFHY